MSDKYIRTIRRLAKDRSLDANTAEKLLVMRANDAGEWKEELHPRGKGGKFAKKGSGGGGESSESSSGNTGKAAHSTAETFKSPADLKGRTITLGNEKGHKTVIRQSKTNPNEFETEHYSNYSLTPVKGSMNMKAFKNELIMADPEHTKISGGEEPKANETTELVKKPETAKHPRKPESGSGIAGMIRARRITRAGEASVEHQVTDDKTGKRLADKSGAPRNWDSFPEGSAFNKPKTGRPTKELQKGTGATKLSTGDLYKAKDPDAKHTINSHLDDNGNLTPEREELHAQAVENLFAGKKPKGPGEKKTFTMFGGGSAAGKGGLSDPKRCGQFKSSFFTNGTPSKDTVATIDSDELKKDIPEYREMMESDPDNAAAVAHEESSALAKRAMQAAFENGYDCTLDGTGDGSVEGVRKKIKQAREAGYEVNACYVTCPTEQAVKQAKKRAQRTGRNVKEGVVRSIHRDVSRIFPEVASDFDNCALFDTSDHSKPPVLIAECVRGGKLQIKNQELWDAFIAKGKE